MRLTALALMAGSAALPAMAQEVNVYSHRQPELIQPLIDAFTAETGIDVNLAYVDKGMVERLQAEGDRSPADLVMTVDVARLGELKEAGVLQPVEDEALARIPDSLHDSDNRWFALTTRARIVYASKDRVADGDLTTYEDLADPKWKGRICTRSFTHDYNVALTAAYIAHHGEEETREWLNGVKANLARPPEGGDRDQVKAIWAGQCDISLGNTYYMGAMLKDDEQKEWADSVRIVFPTFEDGGTHVNVSGVAMTNASPNSDAAKKLMDFLVSDQAQSIYAETNNEFPVVEGVPASDLVASWGEFTADDLPLTEISELRPRALDLIEEVNFDG
ncbi:Fe(3+) ABC transporter substrate-binding protein [Paracoccus sp. 1_MG-2023]|uniref:Fe(3+) ABC transporter substrate-binding protein n=1 Tax=unclassified Paracoccus (in: a-proteobacteria) TaxID=2688777 RepID=UPI001C081980|nr:MULTISPECIES: Fe(3+) ABC transporter substrate-binding protein [unclassified Paracoccus (in: a-proteobacteria)]MBU2958564.1 Fe(3+) ABC transporter substrate-binding protein [Paracoccus sp. C2R09]MDO6667557.1 Fe(3+) ABC transporter substrate-binding protein [Paracoccus sp. 1_MG-2023]